MSSNHQLQNKIKGPRESVDDARVARMHTTVRATGSDGKLYNKVDERDASKYHVLSEEDLKVEQRRNNEIKRSIQLTNKSGSKYAADGLAKSTTVGTASHKTKLATHHQKFPIAGGAESKTVETIRKGDVGVIHNSDAKSQSKDVEGPQKPSAGSKSGAKISTKTHTLSPQSKAYEKNMDDITGIMRNSESGAQAKELLPAPVMPGRGDQAMPPASPVREGGKAQHAPRPTSSSSSPTRTTKSKVLTKEQAILLHDEKIRQERLEREAYAKEQAERFHRASVSGKGFDAMLRRAEKHHMKVQAKAEEKKRQQIQSEKEARELRDRKRREHLQKELNPPGELSWREIQEQAEIKRRETAEKRKQELAASSQAPAAAGSVHADQERAMREAAKRAEYEAAHNFTFKAEDPEKVAAKLARQSAAWERCLEEEKEKVRQRMNERLLASSGRPTKSPLAGMEKRADEAAARRAARNAAREEKLAAEAAKTAELERKKAERLFNMKVPEEGRRLTKAATYRANVVQAKFKEKEEAAKKEADAQKIREKKEKEMSKMLSYQIKDWEKRRREENNYRELSEAELEQNRREARKNYKANIKRNQERLKEVLSERPSLLERHEQALTAKTAATKALSKVAAAVHGGKTSKNSSYDDEFDFFNDEEKIKLSVVS